MIRSYFTCTEFGVPKLLWFNLMFEKLLDLLNYLLILSKKLKRSIETGAEKVSNCCWVSFAVIGLLKI